MFFYNAFGIKSCALYLFQYGVQCFCGNTLDPAKYTLKPDKDCHITCPGNQRQKCGASWRNSMYHGMHSANQ